MGFHSVGDTGGVNTPAQIENVATYMEKDFAGSDVTKDRSALFGTATFPCRDLFRGTCRGPGRVRCNSPAGGKVPALLRRRRRSARKSTTSVPFHPNSPQPSTALLLAFPHTSSG